MHHNLTVAVTGFCFQFLAYFDNVMVFFGQLATKDEIFGVHYNLLDGNKQAANQAEAERV